jgi:hypothetical protein
MAHFLRVMTENQEAPSLPKLTKLLEDGGFEIVTFPSADDERFADPNWRTFHLAYDRHKLSLILDRSVKGDAELDEEIAEFFENLKQVEGEGKSTVEAILSGTRQILALLIPDDITEQGWEVAEFLLEQLLEATDGHLQVDGEGFYDKEGELLFEME